MTVEMLGFNIQKKQFQKWKNSTIGKIFGEEEVFWIIISKEITLFVSKKRLD